MSAYSRAFDRNLTGNPYVYCRGGSLEGSAFHARMFAPDAGIPEDPATGSAVATFAGGLARFEGVSEGAHSFQIEQGVEMGRPSLISLDLVMVEGALTQASIGGFAVRVSSGKVWVR